MFDWLWRVVFLFIILILMRVTKESGFEFYYLINTFLLTIGVIPITAKLFKFQIFNSKNITKPMETKPIEKLEPINNNNSLTKDMENTSEERLEEERLYEFVMKELKSGERREGLWTKAMVQASGDEKQTEIEYIKLRVQSLIDEKERIDREIENKERIDREIKNKERIDRETLDRKKINFGNSTFYQWVPKKIRRFLMWTIILLMVFYFFWYQYMIYFHI